MELRLRLGIFRLEAGLEPWNARPVGKQPVIIIRSFWIRVGQGPTVLAVSAGGGCLDIFSLVYHFSFLPLSGRRPDID